MALFNSFTFDGILSTDYGVYISGESVYDAPERHVEMITIPGKSGKLAVDYGRFENIEVRYPAGVVARTQADFREKIGNLRNALAKKYSYVRLTDTYNPEYYRLAIYKSGLEAAPESLNHAAKFDIVFDCKPQRYLVSGDSPWEEISGFQILQDENGADLQNENGVEIEVAQTLITTIVNPTEWPSKPLIIATGPGTIQIGSQKIELWSVREGASVYIDCESMEIYTLSGGVPQNMSSSLLLGTNDFPVIQPGTNSIAHTMPIQIIPRWWRL